MQAGDELVVTTVRLRWITVEALDLLADHRGVSRSELVRDAIDAWFAREYVQAEKRGLRHLLRVQAAEFARREAAAKQRMRRARKRLEARSLQGFS